MQNVTIVTFIEIHFFEYCYDFLTDLLNTYEYTLNTFIEYI